MFKNKFLVFILIANSICIYGQKYSIDFINHKNGLTQSCGHTITRHNGYMWFGTQDGLNRYDGTRIKAFKVKDYPHMKSNYINAILPDSKNKLWIGTTEGLSLLDTETNKFISVNGDSIKFVKRLYKDDYGNLWVTPQNKGLYQKKNNSDIFLNIRFFQNDKIIDFDEYNCEIFIATSNDIYNFDISHNKFIKLELSSDLKSKMGEITSFLIQKNGYFWVGTFKKGVYLFTEHKGKLFLQSHFSTDNSEIRSNEITKISEDAKGNIWLGTRASSAYIYSGKNWFSVNDFYKSSNSINGYIFSFYHDEQDITWIGTDGDGIARCDASKNKFTKVLEFDKNKFNFVQGEMVFDINGYGSKIYVGVKDKYMLEFDEKTNLFKEFEDHDLNYFKNHPRQMILEGDKIWIGSDKGLRQYNIKENKYAALEVPKQVIFIYTVCLVGDDELWAGGTEGLTRMNKMDLTVLPIKKDHPLFGISSLLIRNLFRDKFGKIWIGTVGHGLFCYDPVLNTLIEINLNRNFDCNGIRCFLEDAEAMFIGTDCGLYKIDQNYSVIKKVTESDGLPNDVIYSIEKSRKSGYWLASNQGLTYATENFTKFENYTEEDGLPGNEFNTNCSYVSESGIFYFGGMKGMVMFNENEIKNNTFIPLLKVYDVFIDNIALSRNHWINDSTITVEPTQKYVKISFSVSNFSDSENNHCIYKLEGFNDWQNVPNNNEILFTGLKAGKYHLSVKGFNNDDVPAKNMVNLTILVKAPFWQQWWFYLLILLLVFAIIFLWFKKEWKTKEREIKYQSEIEEIRNVALRSQMNPHFIFNCLSAIEYLMISGSDKAQLYLNKFSRLVRNTLDFTNNELVTLRDELNHLNIYMELENLRFNNMIKYTTNIDVEIDVDSIPFPPLILQPLVENSIKHGFNRKISHPEIILNVSKLGNYLLIQLRDNGIGISKSKNIKVKHDDKSYGIEVTKQRLEIFSRKMNKHTDFNITDLNEEIGNGTMVAIKMEL